MRSRSTSTSSRWLGHALGLGTIAVLVAAALALGADSAPRWQTVAPGVQHRVLEPRDVAADLIRFDLDRFAVSLHVSASRRPSQTDGASHGVTGRQSQGALTAAQAAAQTGAALAINGGFFDPQWRPLGLRITEGQQAVALRPRVDWGVFSVRDRRARIEHSRDHREAPAIEAAVQVGPRLLVGGRPTKLKPQVAYRSALAVDATGRFVTVVSTRMPADASALATALARMGEFESAVMLDGGPSSQVFAVIGSLRLDRAGAYAVPDLVLFTERPQEEQASELKGDPP